MLVLLLLSLTIKLVLSAPTADDLIISLPNGQVQGTTYVTDNNITFYGFQGIPYAKPPVGALRFEAPQPAEPWAGVLNATQDSLVCFANGDTNVESEDCLYISVYIPTLKPANKLPVLLWTYGGKFVVGDSRKSSYGPDFLIEDDVIVVMFNYRLGPFGFLSTGDLSIIGNAALKDQALAIKWAHENIEYFGGDPDKITIAGQSAGGASIGLQLVSKKVAGLFRAAIVESGSALTNWTVDRNPKDNADFLTTELGGEIYLNDTQQVKKFLQEKTALEIFTASISVESKHQSQAWPVIEVENEDAFLTESPYELLDSGRFNQVPVIIGICANEAGMFFQRLELAQEAALGFDTDPSSIVTPNIRQNSSDTDAVVKAIQNLYLKEGETFSSNLVALTNYQSDNMFTKGVIKHALLTSKYVPAYVYQFAYTAKSVTSAIPGAEKAAHAAELSYLFKSNRGGGGGSDPLDILTRDRIVRLWTNFVKFLNPTPEKTELIDVIWPTITDNELQFLNINGTLEVRAPIRASYEGWNKIYETYGKKPLITF